MVLGFGVVLGRCCVCISMSTRWMRSNSIGEMLGAATAGAQSTASAITLHPAENLIKSSPRLHRRRGDIVRTPSQSGAKEPRSEVLKKPEEASSQDHTRCFTTRLVSRARPRSGRSPIAPERTHPQSVLIWLLREFAGLRT